MDGESACPMQIISNQKQVVAVVQQLRFTVSSCNGKANSLSNTVTAFQIQQTLDLKCLWKDTNLPKAKMKSSSILISLIFYKAADQIWINEQMSPFMLIQLLMSEYCFGRRFVGVITPSWRRTQCVRTQRSHTADCLSIVRRLSYHSMKQCRILHENLDNFFAKAIYENQSKDRS